eukprot:scaffold11925_cov101-Isochrysis_galbana.AAC.6
MAALEVRNVWMWHHGVVVRVVGRCSTAALCERDASGNTVDWRRLSSALTHHGTATVPQCSH